MMAVRQLDLQITHRCNLRCTYCYTSCYASGEPSIGTIAGSDDRPSDLTPELAQAAIELLVHESGEAVSLSLALWGGEPLLRTDLIRFVAETCRAQERRTGKRIDILVPTNVTLLDAHARALVSEYGIRISLSLDGRPDAHSERRTASGRSAWDLVEPRLRELHEESKGSLPPVRMTVTPERAHRLFEDIAYLHGLGFRQVSFLPASGMSWSVEAQSTLESELDRVADSLVQGVDEGRPSLPYYPPILRRLTVLWTEATQGHLPLRTGNCGAGSSLIAVDTTGDLYPCHRFVAQVRPPSSMKLGTLADGITNGELRDRLAEFSMDAAGVPCATCPSRSSCLSACVARNYQTTGDLSLPSQESCFVQRCLARAATRIHGRLYGSSSYRRYLQPYVDADPDERVLAWIAGLASDEDRIVERIAKKLGIFDPKVREEE